MQPTLFTAAYGAARAAETPHPASPPRIRRKPLAALVAIAGSFRSMRWITSARLQGSSSVRGASKRGA